MPKEVIDYTMHIKDILKQHFGIEGDFARVEITTYKNGNVKVRFVRKKDYKPPYPTGADRYYKLVEQIRQGKTPDEAWEIVMGKYGTMSETTRKKLEKHVEIYKREHS